MEMDKNISVICAIKNIINVENRDFFWNNIKDYF
jgi:hypothetical protein